MGAGAGFKAFVAAHGLVFLVTAMALAYKVPAWGSAALSLSGISLPAVLISVAFFVAGVGSNFLRYASWLAAKRSRRAAVVGVLSVAIVAPPIAYLLHRNGGWFDNADFIVGMVVYLVCPVAIATTVLAPSGLPSLAAVIAAIATIVAVFALPFALRGVYGTRFDAWNAVELTKQLTLRVLLPYVCGMLLALHPTISKVARYMSTALCAVHSAIVAAIAYVGLLRVTSFEQPPCLYSSWLCVTSRWLVVAVLLAGGCSCQTRGTR
jgi:predicted Na+-dependent transporter